MINDKNIIYLLEFFIKKNSIKNGENIFYNSKINILKPRKLLR